ncbi:hydroxymethylglutaryl-CoA reductase, degradative [Streptococcus sp. zg-JUN1979]|uniref:hydroxymethylglutaryl-CoA reductase, degradative n=1 Tax=Streptococcus sp. zg-JUN1979 TaxID=3391450 RepID=UPI0039A4CEA3
MRNPMTTDNINWARFAKKTPEKRLSHIEKAELLSPQQLAILKENQSLSIDTANQMVENVLMTHSLPFGLVPEMMVDNRLYHVPMVTEEPSVIAAASFASKIIQRSGGFHTSIEERQMIGQVALYDIADKEVAKEAILTQKDWLIEQANLAYPSIVKRGGGARELWLEDKDDFVIVYLSVDTKEAMGANMTNTMMEALSPLLERLTQGQSLMAILSNYATKTLVSTHCSIDLRFLSRNPKEATKLARKIALASKLAQSDPYRASTHNKGIFNGIDALVLAVGNDWRAIEAAGHTFASRNGQYQGLSEWEVDTANHCLKGRLTMPMPIATKGGSIGLNPSVQVAHELLGHPSATELARVAVSLGLAQNFAALKALTSTGIQAGHMSLQAKSLALLAGANETEAALLASKLLTEKHLNLETAQKCLGTLRANNS